MSHTTIRDFYQKAESDKELKAQLVKVAVENERAAVDQVVEIARTAGYRFTAGELAEVRAELVQFFPGLGETHSEDKKWCCHYAQGCMPGFLAPE